MLARESWDGLSAQVTFELRSAEGKGTAKNSRNTIPEERNNQCRSPESVKSRKQFQRRKQAGSVAELLQKKGRVGQYDSGEVGGFETRQGLVDHGKELGFYFTKQ